MEKDITARAQQALEKWQSAREQWKEQPPSSPLVAACHPWSEAEFLQRLQSFGSQENHSPEVVRLAAEGFALVNGEVKCVVCGQKTPLNPPTTEGGGRTWAEHNPLCPWKGRPFAELKTSWTSQYSKSGNIYDNTRHALDSIEHVHQVMKSMSRSGGS